MNVNDVLDYVKHTPENTNPNVLSGMLEGLVKDNADFTNLKGYTVNFDWEQATASDCNIDIVTTSGVYHYDQTDGQGELPSKAENVVLIANLSPFYDAGGSSGIVKKLDGTIVDLSDPYQGVIPSRFIPLSDLTVKITTS